MKQVVIMPGGFHPFHAGHYALYKQAVESFPGADVYVAATNDTSTRPFPFAIKEKLAKLAGVAPGRFVQVKSPFQAREITANYDPNTTQLIFVRSEKDATKPPQAGGVKKDGTPAYLQPLKGQQELAPMSKHAYMAYLPTVEFGPGMTSATEIRAAWPNLNEKRKAALVMSLYPKTQKNPKLAATIVKMLDMAIMGEESVAENDNPWGSQGNFAGDTKVNIGGVTLKRIQTGDTVTYFGEKARVVDVDPVKNYARISANGKTLNVRLSDLKQLGNPEVDEARIITPNSLVNVFYKPQGGKKVVQVAKKVPADKAQRVIDTYVQRHATTPGMSRIYPTDFEMQVAGNDQYTINEDADYIEEK